MFGITFAFRFRNLYVKGTYRRNYDWIVSILWRICVSEFLSVWMASLYLARREGIAPDSQAPYQTPMTTSQNTTLPFVLDRLILLIYLTTPPPP